MKKYITFISILYLASCKKSEIPVYTSAEGISFCDGNGFGGNSLDYNFATKKGIVTRDTVYIRMRITGNASKTDLEIPILVDTATTATEGVDFLLPKATLPANAFIANIPVVLLSTPALLTQTNKIVLKVGSNKGLIPGAVGQALGYEINYNDFSIYMKNKLEKPGYWGDVQSYYGAYSMVKHKFMIDVLNTNDLCPRDWDGYIFYIKVINMALTVKTALAEYTVINGPLKDENNQVVSFP